MSIAWPTVDPDDPPPAPERHRKVWKWPAVAGGAVVALVAGIAIMAPDRSPGGTPVAVAVTTTTAAPTTTTSPPPATEAFEGDGDSAVQVKRGAVPGVLAFECLTCAGAVTLESDGPETVLVNRTGSYRGKKLINIGQGSMITNLRVRAKGAWKISITGLETAEIISGKQASGRGDAVVRMADTFGSATVTYKGRGTFVVTYADPSARTLNTAVDKVGNHQGTVPLPGPAIVQIESAGTWTIKPVRA